MACVTVPEIQDRIFTRIENGAVIDGFFDVIRSSGTVFKRDLSCRVIEKDLVEIVIRIVYCKRRRPGKPLVSPGVR